MHIKEDKNCIIYISYVVLQMYREISAQQSAMFLREQNHQILRHSKCLLRTTANGFLTL